MPAYLAGSRLSAAWAMAVVCTLRLLAPAQALADPPTVALLDFTARHLDSAQVQQFSRNLRETFLIDPRFAMMDETTMYEALNGPDGEAVLHQARRHLAEAKRAYRAGEVDRARRDIEDARAMYRSLHSELSRPHELADLLLYEGLVDYASGNADAAKVAFLQMFLLNPDLDTRRLPPIPQAVHDLLDDAREQVRSTPLRGIRAAFARELAESLHVAFLVTGVVEKTESGAQSGARITVQLIRPSSEEPVAVFVFEVPTLDGGLPPAGDPLYERIVGVMARYLLAP